MAKPRPKETKVSGYERGVLLAMEIAKNLLFILPFGAPYFKSNLAASNLPATELLHLMLRNVMVQNNQATALRLVATSLTIPCWISARASLIAAGLIMPRY